MVQFKDLHTCKEYTLYFLFEFLSLQDRFSSYFDNERVQVSQRGCKVSGCYVNQITVFLFSRVREMQERQTAFACTACVKFYYPKVREFQNGNIVENYIQRGCSFISPKGSRVKKVQTFQIPYEHIINRISRIISASSNILPFLSHLQNLIP